MDIVLIIAIPVLLVLAAVMIVATGRRARRRRRGSRHRNAERARRASATRAAAAAPSRRRRATSPRTRATRADETRKAIGSGGAAPATRGTTAVAEREPVDEEELGVTRRQFFNRGDPRHGPASASARSAPRALGFLWPTAAGGFGGKVDAGSASTTSTPYDVDNKEPVLRARGARPTSSPYPKDDLPKAKKVPRTTPVIAGMEAGHRRAVPEVRAPRLPGAVVPDARSGSSARATARSTTGSARSSGGPAPRGLDRFVVDGLGRQHHRSTPAPSSSARRSAPTPPARAPRDRLAWLTRRTTPNRPLDQLDSKRRT